MLQGSTQRVVRAMRVTTGEALFKWRRAEGNAVPFHASARRDTRDLQGAGLGRAGEAQEHDAYDRVK